VTIDPIIQPEVFSLGLRNMMHFNIFPVQYNHHQNNMVSFKELGEKQIYSSITSQAN
jgi:hypothetical protein